MGKKSIELDIRIPNQTRYLSLIGRIGKDVAGELEKEGGRREALADRLNTVLTEAMTNAIVHAHDGDPEKTVHISISITEDELRIRVFDQGQGFDLNSVPVPDFDRLEEHGHGIYIIRCLMDTVAYRRFGDHNVLEMRKKLK